MPLPAPQTSIRYFIISRPITVLPGTKRGSSPLIPRAPTASRVKRTLPRAHKATISPPFSSAWLLPQTSAAPASSLRKPAREARRERGIGPTGRAPALSQP
jgi:hypothetical protein